MFIRQVVQPNFHIIFIFQPVLEHVKLQNANYPYDNLFQPRIELLENLDGAFLGNLLNSLHELLPLHRVHLAKCSGAKVGIPSY